MGEIIGWASSVVLLLTLIKQVHKQWVGRTSKGISKWLYVGQLAASVGFVIYSIYTKNWVFVFTNAALTVNNIFGLILYYHFAKLEDSSPDH